jgi:retron-type reverse transcriptase
MGKAKGRDATVVAERIVDSAILHVLKLWLKAPGIFDAENGTRKHVGDGKAYRKSTPQGDVISPLLSNRTLFH